MVVYSVYSQPTVTHCSGCGAEFEEHEPWGRGAKFCPGGCKNFLPTIDAQRRANRAAGDCYRCGAPPDPGMKTCGSCRELESRKRAARRKAAAGRGRAA